MEGKVFLGSRSKDKIFGIQKVGQTEQSWAFKEGQLFLLSVCLTKAVKTGIIEASLLE